MITQLVTSPDGQWVVARHGRQVSLLAGGSAPAVGVVELEADDADVAIVNGPPNVLVTAARSGATTRIQLHYPPELETTARIDLAMSARIAAIAAGRLVMVSRDHKEVAIVRANGRGLASHTVDLQGGMIDFVTGIERNQLVVGQAKKLEVWDAVSGRPLRKLALELPPPHRTIGAAAGHLWVTRPNSDEVFVYRLSDGRPFRHYIGAPVDHVISHPGSPLVVLVTRKGLVRLHCYAHSLFTIEAPAWVPGSETALAQLVIGEDISLLGLAAGAAEPWRVAIGGVGAPLVVEADAPPGPVLVTAADKLRAMRDAASATVASNAAVASTPLAAVTAKLPTFTPAPPPTPSAPVAPSLPVTPPHSRSTWREALAVYGAELARGGEPEAPLVAIDTELGDLGHRRGLSLGARRALVALYATHLVGEPALSIARLARLLSDWTEPLGQGQLGALALIDRDGGKVQLAQPVTDLLDGARPREVRLVGGAPTTPQVGAYRLAREGRTDAEIETALATRLHRIAIVEGAIAPGMLEARIHGATAVSFAAPTSIPRPWPHGAGLVLVLYGTTSAWLADLASL
ncbi:hypothetical protein BH11MYX1_BH11MYX1_23590 [soil metagenome]